MKYDFNMSFKYVNGYPLFSASNVVNDEGLEMDTPEDVNRESLEVIEVDACSECGHIKHGKILSGKALKQYWNNFDKNG